MNEPNSRPLAWFACMAMGIAVTIVGLCALDAYIEHQHAVHDWFANSLTTWVWGHQ